MDSIRATARRAGALYFVFLMVGLVDMYAFSHFIVPGDATATARNIMAAEQTYRIGILTDFVALLLFILLVVSLYHLLKGVDKWHAMLMVLLVSVGVTIGLANLLNKIAPLILLSVDLQRERILAAVRTLYYEILTTERRVEVLARIDSKGFMATSDREIPSSAVFVTKIGQR